MQGESWTQGGSAVYAPSGSTADTQQGNMSATPQSAPGRSRKRSRQNIVMRGQPNPKHMRNSPASDRTHGNPAIKGHQPPPNTGSSATKQRPPAELRIGKGATPQSIIVTAAREKFNSRGGIHSFENSWHSVSRSNISLPAGFISWTESQVGNRSSHDHDAHDVGTREFRHNTKRPEFQSIAPHDNLLHDNLLQSQPSVQLVALPHLKKVECRCGVVLQALAQRQVQVGVVSTPKQSEREGRNEGYDSGIVSVSDSDSGSSSSSGSDGRDVVCASPSLQSPVRVAPLAPSLSLPPFEPTIIAVKILDSELMRQQRDSFTHEVEMMALLQTRGMQEPLAHPAMLRWDCFTLQEEQQKQQQYFLQNQANQSVSHPQHELQCVAMECAWGQTLSEWVLRQVESAEKQLVARVRQRLANQQVVLSERTTAGETQSKTPSPPSHTDAEIASSPNVVNGVVTAWFGVAVHLFTQIMEAVQYLHSKGVCHLDLDFGNVMMDKPGWPASVKMVDYGSCQKVGIAASTPSSPTASSSTPPLSSSSSSMPTSTSTPNTPNNSRPLRPLTLHEVKTKLTFCAPELTLALGALGKRERQNRVRAKQQQKQQLQKQQQEKQDGKENRDELRKEQQRVPPLPWVDGFACDMYACGALFYWLLMAGYRRLGGHKCLLRQSSWRQELLCHINHLDKGACSSIYAQENSQTAPTTGAHAGIRSGSETRGCCAHAVHLCAICQVEKGMAQQETQRQQVLVLQPPWVRKILANLLHQDPTQRMNPAQVLDVLQSQKQRQRQYAAQKQ